MDQKRFTDCTFVECMLEQEAAGHSPKNVFTRVPLHLLRNGEDDARIPRLRWITSD